MSVVQSRMEGGDRVVVPWMVPGTHIGGTSIKSNGTGTESHFICHLIAKI